MIYINYKKTSVGSTRESTLMLKNRIKKIISYLYNMEKILITGGSGLIGQNLTQLLLKEGYEVIHLVRSVKAGSPVKLVSWNPEKKELDANVFENIDHMIHLAGSNISAGRWTKKRKREIYASRIETAQLLFEKSAHASFKTFISASGISIYGTLTSEKVFKEEDATQTDFLAQVTLDWEKAADLFAQRNARVVKLRTAVVLSPQGGALRRMAKPIRMGLGSALGSGKQYFPWIHIDDLCRIYLKALKDQTLSGTYNAAAPEHCTNRTLTQKTAAALGKKIRLPAVPAFLLKLVFGEMANLILKGSRISSEKIQKTGFEFQYPELDKALKDCLK
jgi:uncharacterized protein